jgi:hypothetical protein
MDHLGMPNRKTDTNNGRGFSTDYIGFNYAYPEASYEEREKIIEAHRNYQKGLMWTLANHPRVPEKIGKKYRDGVPVRMNLKKKGMAGTTLCTGGTSYD